MSKAAKTAVPAESAPRSAYYAAKAIAELTAGQALADEGRWEEARLAFGRAKSASDEAAYCARRVAYEKGQRDYS